MKWGKPASKPYTRPMEEPKEGNRLLANRKITWLEKVHHLHEEKGMGWVSPHGCPEDGQHAYDAASMPGEIKRYYRSDRSNFDL